MGWSNYRRRLGQRVHHHRTEYRYRRLKPEKGNWFANRQIVSSEMNRKGLLITFEGLEGSGKTTQIKLLAKALRKKKYSVIVTQEPGGTPVGAKIRRILLESKKDKLFPESEAFLFLADRVHHMREVIVPALRKKQIVLSDRFLDSTVAYQGFGRRLSVKFLEHMNQLITDGLVPHATLFLDLDPEKGLSRIQRRKRLNRMDKEKIAFYRAVRKGYLAIARGEPRVKILDADQNPDVLHAQILKKVLDLLT